MADIIVFGEDYGRHPSSTQHLMNRLVKNHTIIWCNSIGLRSPQLSLHDIKRVAAKLIGMMSRNKQEQSITPFPVAQPFALPFPASKLARYINRILLKRFVKKLIHTHQLHQPILWASLPSAVDAISPEIAKIVYYCGDDFSSLEGVDHAPVTMMEQELVARADRIFASSESLVAQMPAAKTHYIPHGVDVALFSQITEKPALYHAPKKRACFYGSLADWVRLDWIAAAAKHLPQWEFILIGHTQTDISPLEVIPNIILTGALPHQELVAYASHADVLMMPFHDTEQIRHCNPLKLREYLAISTPIVATQFPATAPYAKLINFAHDESMFIKQLQAAAQEDVARNDQRRAAVAHEDWYMRAEQVERLL